MQMFHNKRRDDDGIDFFKKSNVNDLTKTGSQYRLALVSTPLDSSVYLEALKRIS